MTPNYLPTPAELVARGFTRIGQIGQSSVWRLTSSLVRADTTWHCLLMPAGDGEDARAGISWSNGADNGYEEYRLRDIRDFDALLRMLGLIENHPTEQ